MKKLYSIAVAALTALSMNAQIYFCGDGTGLGWDPSNPKQVDLTGDSYTVTLNNVTKFKFSTQKGSNSEDWNTFNGNAKGYSGNFESSKVYPNGQTVNIENWGEDQIMPYTSNYTITINKDLTQMTVKASGADPNAGSFPKVYMRGYNSWDASASNEMTTTDGNIYTKAGVNLTTSSQFKIADGSYGSINYGYSGKFPVGQEKTLTFNGGNISVESAVNDATVTFNLKNHTLLITSDGGVVENDFTGWYVGVGGSFTDNKYDVYETKSGADGMVTITNVPIGNEGFEVKVYDLSGDTYYNNASGNLTVGTWTSVGNVYGSKLYIAGAVAGDVFDVQFNLAKGEVCVTKVSADSYPENMYVIGTIPAWSENGEAMTNNGDGTYSISNLEISAADGSDFGYFAFTSAYGDWDQVNANRYGPNVSGTEAKIGSNPVDGSGDVSWTIEPATYNLTFDYANKKMTVEAATTPATPTLEIGEIVVTNEDGGATVVVPVVAKNFPAGTTYTVVYNQREDEDPKSGRVEVDTESMTATIVFTGLDNDYDYYFVCYAVASNGVKSPVNEEFAIKPTAPKPDPDPTSGFYILGEVNGNSWAPNVGVAMDDEGDNMFTKKNVQVGSDEPGFGYFSFTVSLAEDSDWSNLGQRYGAPYNNYEFSDLEVGNESEAKIQEGENSFKVPNGVYNFYVSLDGEKKIFTIEPIEIYELEGPSEVYIKGDMNEWEDSDTWKMTYNEADNNYTFTCEGETTIEAGVEFKFADSNWGIVNYGYVGALVLNETITLDNKEENNNMSFNGDFTGTITLTLTDGGATVLFAGETEETEPTTFYVIGNIENNVWNVANPVEFTPVEGEEGVYKIDDITFVKSDDDNAYFAFTSVKSEDENWNYVNANRFGPAENNTPVSVSPDPFEVVKNGATYTSWMVNPGRYSLVFDYKKMTLKVDKPSGVYGVGVDADAPVRYFNLQGVEVVNPESGVYIEVRGNRATKVYVK